MTFTTTHVDEFTFTTNKVAKGSNMLTINVDLNGHPFGQIWTFKNTKTETHKWHAKVLDGHADCHSGNYAAFDTKAEAMTFMRSKA